MKQIKNITNSVNMTPQIKSLVVVLIHLGFRRGVLSRWKG